MSNYRDPNDPMYGYEPADRTGSWGWIAGVACLVIILALGLTMGVGCLGSGSRRALRGVECHTLH